MRVKDPVAPGCQAAGHFIKYTLMMPLFDEILLSILIAKYFASRAGLAKTPHALDTWKYSPGLGALARMLGWTRNNRREGVEHVPAHGPALFAGNHVNLDDPFVTSNAIHIASRRGIHLRIMMRDDFFKGFPKWLVDFVDFNKVATLIGAILISRQKAGPEQLQPFMDLLLADKAFLIYPGRSRSRCGIVFEYRDWIRSPGKTSHFPSEFQTLRPGERLPVIPVMRTVNLVTRRTTIRFGAACYLASDLEPEQQREFDFALVERIAELVEVNVAQITSLILYLRCLHGLPPAISMADLEDAARRVLERQRHPFVEPDASTHLARHLRATLAFFQKAGILVMDGANVIADAPRILSAPVIDDRYRKKNPLKFFVNQVLHVPSLLEAAEAVVLDPAP